MEKGLVSVIMPSWNTGKFIAESIQSVINQTYSNWELIIVDDCSNDNTDSVVKQFLSDSRIKYFKNEHNSGAAVTRNKALREANGEWIAFLDSDDLWLPEKLEKQIDFMISHDYVFSYHEYEKIDVEKNVAKVSIVGAGMMSNAGVAAKMFEALYDEGINIKMISTSEIRVSILIDEKYTEKAMNAIHDKFDLGE